MKSLLSGFAGHPPVGRDVPIAPLWTFARVCRPLVTAGPTASMAAIAGMAFLLLSGCAVGPDYQRPSALRTNAMPAAFLGPETGTNTGPWKTAQPSAHFPRGAWWEVFNDPELNRLEMLASAENQELAIAAARFKQARALVDVARSDFLPHVSADPSYTRQRSSLNQPQNGRAAGTSPTFNNFTVALQAGWEVDLWGRVRREVEASRARLAASADDVEAARLGVQSELATDYFALRFTDAEYELIQRTVQTYASSLDLTRNRRVGGIATDLDVAQAEAQLRAAEAQLPAVALRRAKLRHALAAVCGQSAAGFEWTVMGAPASEIPAIPISLPSELLERRPDIAAAERRMAAANAEVGVARAAFYPRIRLNGLAGFQSVAASTLFDWPSRLWAVGPSLDLPLFTGGRNRAQLAGTRAAYDETVARYRQSVLIAFREVEDQLAAQSLLAAQLGAEAAALTAARRTLEIANNRYKAGLVTYLEVATAQSAALVRERTVIQLRTEQLAASVALVKALGGGWNEPAGR